MTDWLVFGDDWGAHPSTTQHLVRELVEAGDRVVWVDGIGMRAPTLSTADARRIAGRLQALLRPHPRAVGDRSDAAPVPDAMRVVSPFVLPWHRRLTRLNARLLHPPIREALRALGIARPHALIANPMGALYLRGLPVDRTIYLRLDDHSAMPGVDATHVAAVEQQLFDRADLVVATARQLLPPALHVAGKARYLPQGVDMAHFGVTPLAVPDDRPRVLGFFGLLEAWIDAELVLASARRRPDWVFEFIGRNRWPAGTMTRLDGVENVRFRGAVPYMELPSAVSRWHAAWAPFSLSQLTEGVNPLKLREYLAIGLPTACTPLPEVAPLGSLCASVRDAEEVSAWLDDVARSDSEPARRQRREAMRGQSWADRAAQLRAMVEEARGSVGGIG